MRVRQLEGRGDFRLVYSSGGKKSRKGELLGIISSDLDPNEQVPTLRYYVYLFCAADKFESIGWLPGYKRALAELKRYE